MSEGELLLSIINPVKLKNFFQLYKCSNFKQFCHHHKAFLINVSLGKTQLIENSEVPKKVQTFTVSLQLNQITFLREQRMYVKVQSTHFKIVPLQRVTENS